MNQFGWTMAISIMVSMLVAFTLTPTLSARLLKREVKRKGHEKHGHHGGWMERLYVRSLEWSMAHRWAIVMVCLVTLGSTFVVNKYIGRDWMPQEDQSELGIWLELPEGSSIEATEKLAIEVREEAGEIARCAWLLLHKARYVYRARDDGTGDLLLTIHQNATKSA